HADHAHLGDSRVHREHLFDLGRVHVEARHDDQVLGPVDEVQVPVGVDGRDVTGAQPAVDEHLVGGIAVTPVPLEHVGTGDPNLTGVTRGYVVAVVADEPYRLADEHPAHGAVPHRGTGR